MDNPNPIYYRDLITPDDSITNLIGQLEDLIAEYNKAKSNIQGAAADIAKGLQGVSGATEEQRKAIQLSTEQSEKLVAEYRDVTSASWKATQAFAEATAAKKESAQVDKLITQINTSAAGSYNKLSAQYRLNKIRLNEMSAAERKGTEAGRKLEEETNAIYQEMKRLQEATGKHTLNVGHYADAGKSLRMELKELTAQMAYLKTQGEQNSEEYQQMAQRAGILRDSLNDTSREINAMASDTSALDSVMGAATAASGGFAAVTGAMNLIGVSSDSAAEAQRKLGGAIALVSGLTAVQNALQKESALMTGIRTLQTAAATKAEELNTKAQGKNVIATTAATVAQGIFNAVAAANPYVLLAMALITVIGALIAFASSSSKAAKEQTKLNKATAAQMDYMDQLAQSMTRANNERIQQLNNELEVAKARGASISETQKIEDEIYNERVKAHAKQMELYGEQLAAEEANRAKMQELYDTLLELKKAQAKGDNKIIIDVDLDGKVEKVEIEDAIEAVQGQIDNLGRAVQISVDLKTEGAEIEKDRAVQIAQRRKTGQQIAKTETDVLRAAQDAKLALIKDGYKREQQTLKNNAQRQIDDIATRLKTEANLTAKARKALQGQQKAIAAKYYKDLAALQHKYQAIGLAAQRETEDAQFELMADGAEKERQMLLTQYSRRINDLQTALKNEDGLTEKQREEMLKQIDIYGELYTKKLGELNQQLDVDQMNADAKRIQLRLDATREGSQEQVDLSIELLKKQRDIEIAENAQLADDLKQDEADIRAKWDATILKQTAELTKKRAEMLLEADQELAASEFALLDSNERQKTQFQLQQERERLQKLLELDEQSGYKMTEAERKTMENTIKAIDKERKKMPYNNMYELLGIGLDSDQQSALDTAIDSVKESISSITDAWAAAADAAVSSADKQVEATQKVLDAEIEARNNGYANNVEAAQKELELAKENQQKALKEREKAQKAQLAIDTITQASSLITASANIWKSLSEVPVVGPGLAIAALATMWGSFAAAKIKAIQVSGTEQYEHGTVELLQGGSHASGHDIDLGTKPDGTRRRAEGGEYFAVINKRNSRRYGHIIPEVINAFNNGTFADKYQRANADMSGLAFGLVSGNTDVSKLEKDVSAIRQQGDQTQYVDGQGNTIIRYRNLTRKIKN